MKLEHAIITAEPLHSLPVYLKNALREAGIEAQAWTPQEAFFDNRATRSRALSVRYFRVVREMESSWAEVRFVVPLPFYHPNTGRAAQGSISGYQGEVLAGIERSADILGRPLDPVCPKCNCRRSKDIHAPGYSCDFFSGHVHAPGELCDHGCGYFSREERPVFPAVGTEGAKDPPRPEDSVAPEKTLSAILEADRRRPIEEVPQGASIRDIVRKWEAIPQDDRDILALLAQIRSVGWDLAIVQTPTEGSSIIAYEPQRLRKSVSVENVEPLNISLGAYLSATLDRLESRGVRTVRALLLPPPRSGS